MDVNEFRARYNARVAELGASAKAECLGVIKRTDYQRQGLQDKAGDAHMMATRTQGVSIMHIGGAIKGAIVYAPMDSSKLMDGLVAYSACLNIMTGLSAKKRNELLANTASKCYCIVATLSLALLAPNLNPSPLWMR